MLPHLSICCVQLKSQEVLISKFFTWYFRYCSLIRVGSTITDAHFWEICALEIYKERSLSPCPEDGWGFVPPNLSWVMMGSETLSDQLPGEHPSVLAAQLPSLSTKHALHLPSAKTLTWPNCTSGSALWTECKCSCLMPTFLTAERAALFHPRNSRAPL